MSNDIRTQASEILKSDFFTSSSKLLIGGQWLDAQTGETLDVYNPDDGKVIAQAAAADAADVDLAVKAAREAFDNGPWSTMTANERAALMWKLADAIEANVDELALIETLDNGKPYTYAKAVDMPGAANKLRYYSGWANKLNGESLNIALPGSYHGYTMREPIGVCGLIVPWNFPLMSAVGKIAPAIAAGCTVILKPAEQTPLSVIKLGELIQEVGFPDGVINIVTGYGRTAGAAIVDHPGVDKVSFTGSTVTGKHIAHAATGNMKRVTLELGGKSPVVIMPDADMATAIAGASSSILFNTGQVCAAGTRLFAHESVFDEVLEGIVNNIKNINIGSGLDPKTEIGPVVSSIQQDRVNSYIDAGIEAGAEVAVGGNRIDREGYFVQPTVFTKTTPDMAIRREEIFGPVLCAMSFSDTDLDKIAADANDTEYGLFSRVYTTNLSTAHQLARKIKAGTVIINGGAPDNGTPVGGFKQSGWGRENGLDGILAYTELKSVVAGI